MEHWQKFILVAVLSLGILQEGYGFGKPSSSSSTSSSRSSSTSSRSSSSSSRSSSRPSTSSSRPSTSSSRPSSTPSSRPSTSSAPKMSSPTPSSRPSSRPTTQVPKTSSSSRPSAIVTKPANKPTSAFDNSASTAQKKVESKAAFDTSKSNQPKPIVSTPSSRPSVTSVPAPSTRPSTVLSPVGKPANKPTTSFDSAASTAQKKVESKVALDASKPKVATSTVKPNVTSTTIATQRIRTVPKEKVQQHTVRVEHHYHNVYGNRYDYYRSQPVVWVGGGYSSLFWYAMNDWDYQRRAAWLYHNQNLINQDLYAQQMQNAQLRAEVDRLRAQNIPVNSNYVDPEFKENQDLMYDNDVVQTAYKPVSNPTTTAKVAQSQSSGSSVFFYVLGAFLLLGFGIAVVYFVFIYDIKGIK